MTTKTFARFALTTATTLAATAVVTALPEAAHAVTVFDPFRGTTYEITTVTGSFTTLSPILTDPNRAPWWGSFGVGGGLGGNLAGQVGDKLGFPNFAGLGGPFFAFTAPPPTFGSPRVQGFLVNRANNSRVNEFAIPTSNTFTFAVVNVTPPAISPAVDFLDNPISFDFEEKPGEVEVKSSLDKTPQTDGFSIDGLSYLLTSQSTAPISFSWNASRDFNLSGGGDIFASILGNTNLQLTGGLPTSLEFFVEGYIDNQASPFARFSEDDLAPASGVEFPLDWDETGIVAGLAAGSHTLSIVSGIQWTPSAAGETLFISSQYGGSATPVPTPGLLPGLLGMGVAALRKRRQQGESDRDESLI